MNNGLTIEEMLMLHDLGGTCWALMNQLDNITPEKLPPQSRVGFENALNQVHEKIHLYQQRSEKVFPLPPSQNSP